MFDSTLIGSRFAAGISFEAFVAAAAREQMDAPWRQRYEQLELEPTHATLLSSFTRHMNVLCVTGPWCGDCALQGAAMQRIAEGARGRIDLRFLNRNEHPDIQVGYRINAGDRVPLTFFMAEDGAPVSVLGDRTLSRYRSMARKMLGDGAGVVAPAPTDPVRSVFEEVLDEFERVQLLLRLSTRFRQKYGD